ncbi:MAG TPA: hypothetical protein VIK94_01320 [Bacilli bacterium]
MDNFLLIKYYYTTNNPGLLLPQIQVQVEDLLENLFTKEQVNVYFHFIDVSSSAYFNDFIEVEHSITLTEAAKNKIFDLIKDNVSFSHSDDKTIEEASTFKEFYEQKHYLQFAIFRKVNSTNYIRNDFDE